MNLPRMRTAPEAIKEIQEIDPRSSLTLTALRRMMKTGEIPVTYMIGYGFQTLCPLPSLKNLQNWQTLAIISIKKIHSQTRRKPFDGRYGVLSYRRKKKGATR